MPHFACILPFFSLSLQHILTVLLKPLSVPTYRSLHPSCVVCFILTMTWLFFSFFKQLVIFIACGTEFVEEQWMTRVMLRTERCPVRLLVWGLGQSRYSLPTLAARDERGWNWTHSCSRLRTRELGGRNYLCPGGSSALSLYCWRFH